MRFRRFRFCSRTCIRREFSTNTIILNSATIFESILMKMTTRKHVHEFDVNNDDDFQRLNSFIDVNLVYSCETKINYFWYITLALTLEKTLLLQNNFDRIIDVKRIWSNIWIWNAFDQTSRCKTHFEINTKIL